MLFNFWFGRLRILPLKSLSLLSHSFIHFFKTIFYPPGSFIHGYNKIKHQFVQHVK